MNYGEWLAEKAARFNTTVEHVENITRLMRPMADGPLFRNPVPPIVLRHEYRIDEYLKTAVGKCGNNEAAVLTTSHAVRRGCG